MDILTSLKRNVPADVYDKVFKYTVMHLFRECDIVNAEFDAAFNSDFRYDKMLDEFVVYQHKSTMKFENDFEHTSNKIVWGYKEEKNIDGMMALGMVRFKYLRIVEVGDFSCTYVNFSDFISYAYNKDSYQKDFYIQKSHEVTMKDTDIKTEELIELAQTYPDKSFVVTFNTHPFSIDLDLVKFMDVAKMCPNVKLKVCYFFAASLVDEGFWENNLSNYNLLFEHPHPRIEVFTCVLAYFYLGDPYQLRNWLVAQLSKLGYDKVNHLVLYWDEDEEDEEIILPLSFVQKMTNLEKLSLKGKLIVNEDTLGDLSGLHKLRRLKITYDGYSNEWLSTCLPDNIEEMELFKSVNKMPQYNPIRLSEKLKCLVLTHDNNGISYNLDTRDFKFTNPKCDVFIEDSALAHRVMPLNNQEDQDEEEE